VARIDRLEPARRSQLLSAAAEEFAGRGFDGASLERIARAAGVSKASLYYYFEDKADLYASIMGAAWELLLPEGSGPDLGRLDRETFWPELRQRYFAIVERSQQEPWLVSAGKLFYDLGSAAGAGDFNEAFRERAQAYLRSLLECGRELGVVRGDLPDELLLVMVFAAAQAADRWMVMRWEELSPEQIQALTAPLFELLERMAAPGEGET
jgi:AcrR family transcriptional regulator